MPAAPSWLERVAHARRARSAPVATITSAPAASSASAASARRGARDDDGQRHLGGAGTSWESSGRRASESNTIRRGWRWTPSMRAVSSGSSASAVPIPTATASHSARQWWASRRRGLAGDPLRVAGAGGDLAVERHRRLEQHPGAAGAGVLAERLVEQPRARRRARRSATTTSTPSSRRIPRPRPEAFSVGSSEATTTRAIPASRIASVHGGVRPWWQHGSSETYMRRAARVGPGGARSPRPRRAARRARRGSPPPAPAPSLTMTAPTSGFGLVRPRPPLGELDRAGEMLLVGLQQRGHGSPKRILTHESTLRSVASSGDHDLRAGALVLER